MKLTSFQESIQLQFDTLVKRVIDTSVKDYKKELSRRSKREATFSELSEVVVNSLSVLDTYELDCTVFNVCGTYVRVSDECLSKALKELPERKRNNLLMYYFLELSDTEIADIQQISRAGVYKNRQKSLELLKDSMRKNGGIPYEIS